MNSNNEYPFISVCLPVRNESSFITDTLAQLLAQNYPKDRYEIIVADGFSNDGTFEIVKRIANKFPQIILKVNFKKRSGAGRNIGFKYGKGDIFLIVDGHCYIPTRDLFKNIIKSFDISNADCLGRPQPLNPPRITEFQKMVAIARGSFIGHSGKSYIYSNFEGYVSPDSNGAVYKRHIIESIGMVDENFDACEDVDFNIRVEKAGFLTYMSPSIKIFYYPRENLSSLFFQMLRYGEGRFKLALKHPDYISFNSLIPFFFSATLLFIPIIFLIDFNIGLAVIFLYFLYLLLICFFSKKYIIKYRLPLYVKTIAIFISIHFGLGYGFLIGLLKAINQKIFLILNF